MDISLRKFVVGHEILVYGRRVGYVTETNAINFLVDDQCKLTAEERTEVIRYVRDDCEIDTKPTKQNEKYWPPNFRPDSFSGLRSTDAGRGP